MGSLYINETGAPDAPEIVFLHGIGTSGWMWSRQTAELTDFHCLTVDLPGHGKSSTVEWVSLADTADQIAQIIRERAKIGRAHVVGLSLGGYLTLTLLRRHPEVVERAVVSGVTAEPMSNRVLFPVLLPILLFLMKRQWFANKQAKTHDFSPEEQRAFSENLHTMTLATYQRIFAEAGVFQVSSDFRQIQTPTLVIAGAKEPPNFAASVQTISTIMPNAEGRLVPGYGHPWNVEAPRLFNATVRAWLTGAPLPPELQIVTTHAAT